MARVERSKIQRALPALSLMILAPLIAEVLPGATRISSLFVLPIEIAIWGGGAVMIREVVRRYQLGWRNMLLLAISLSVTEEFLIQQTSLAPVVIKIKGVEYARAFDVNYVYFLWAVIYEVLFVVLIPIGVCELIYRDRRNEPWLNSWGSAGIALCFVPACFLAWYTWTQIARIEVFHLEAYTPPEFQIAIAACLIAFLIFLAVGPLRERIAVPADPLKPPHPSMLLLATTVFVVVLFGLETLAFGIAPAFPTYWAVAIGLGLIAVSVTTMPRFYAHPDWSTAHDVSVLYGAIVANMAVFFIAFREATPLDFYGKVLLDLLAVILICGHALVLWHRRREQAR